MIEMLQLSINPAPEFLQSPRTFRQPDPALVSTCRLESILIAKVEGQLTPLDLH